MQSAYPCVMRLVHCDWCHSTHHDDKMIGIIIWPAYCKIIIISRVICETIYHESHVVQSHVPRVPMEFTRVHNPWLRDQYITDDETDVCYRLLDQYVIDVGQKHKMGHITADRTTIHMYHGGWTCLYKPRTMIARNLPIPYSTDHERCDHHLTGKKTGSVPLHWTWWHLRSNEDDDVSYGSYHIMYICSTMHDNGICSLVRIENL